MQILSGSCAFRVIPQRAHCLTLAKVIDNILPSYILTLSVDQIKDILPISITVFYINTCLGKVTFVTSADGQLRILPGKFEISVSLSITFHGINYHGITRYHLPLYHLVSLTIVSLTMVSLGITNHGIIWYHLPWYYLVSLGITYIGITWYRSQ